MNDYLGNLMTERANEKTKYIDECSTTEILNLINEEDSLVADAVKKVIPEIALAVDTIVDSMNNGGRLFYFGAGTSGRLGVLDASECPPTYGVEPTLVQGYIAGGDKALRTAVEGSEDSEELGRSEIDTHNITDKDVVVGIAASGRTPYVLGAVRRAKEIGAYTIGITTNPDNKLSDEVNVCIVPVVGPEVITGSTRMKSGTAQKLVLNMLTTAAMIKLGKVYGNLMIDLKASNEKLIERSKRIFCTVTGADEKTANIFLNKAQMDTKLAIMMYLSGMEDIEAEDLLKKNNGVLKRALNYMKQVKQEERG